jgi:hypothetical protein
VWISVLAVPPWRSWDLQEVHMPQHTVHARRLVKTWTS